MKKLSAILIISFFAVLTVGVTSCGGNETSQEKTEAEQGKEYTSAYICPMHCEGSGSDQPGNCPVCGMVYVENEEHSHDGHGHDHGDDHDHSHDDGDGHNH